MLDDFSDTRKACADTIEVLKSMKDFSFLTNSDIHDETRYDTKPTVGMAENLLEIIHKCYYIHIEIKDIPEFSFSLGYTRNFGEDPEKLVYQISTVAREFHLEYHSDLYQLIENLKRDIIKSDNMHRNILSTTCWAYYYSPYTPQEEDISLWNKLELAEQFDPTLFNELHSRLLRKNDTPGIYRLYWRFLLIQRNITKSLSDMQLKICKTL